MKKTCEGCKAFDIDTISGLSDWKCDLNYKIDKYKGIPLENCPKPKTYQKWFDLREIKRKYDLTNDELTSWKFP